MAGNIRFVQHGVIELDGAPAVHFGDQNKPFSIAFTEKHEVTVTLAASGKATLLDIVGGQTGNAGGSHMSGVSYLAVASSRDVTLEMIVDEGGSKTRVQSVTVTGSGVAGKLGPITSLFSDDAYNSDHTANFGGTLTMDKWETLRVRNTDGSNTATVWLLAAG